MARPLHCEADHETVLNVKAGTADGRDFEWRWTTPVAPAGAIAKTPGWVRAALRENAQPTRAAITHLSVNASIQRIPEHRRDR
jgi:hypothetical protein